MLWKFIVSALLLPSCLGFEIAAASLQKGVQTQQKSEELKAQVAQIRESSSIHANSEADTEQLKHTKYRHHHKPRRRYYRRYRPQGYKSHYRRRVHQPQYIHYRRRHHNQHRYYHQGGYHPQYIHYQRRYENRYRYYRHGRYYH